MKQLESKRAVVLGGSRGIGAAIVRRLVSDGADVTFTYLGSEGAAATVAKEAGARAARVDSGDPGQLSKFFSDLGEIDILVVNAGVLVMGDPLQTRAEDVDRMIDVNVRGPYFAAIEGARRMREGGRIVVIGSTNADRIPFAGGSAYALTKAAIQGLVRGLARDLGPRGITVNNIQPGPVDTEMNPADGPMSEAMHSFMALRRHIRPDEVASFAAYLVSPEAAMVTGADHTIDGGFAA